MKLKRNLIGLIIAVIILGASGIIGSITGMFSGVEDVTSLINFNGETIIKAIIIIGFLWAVNCILQLIFSLFRGKKGRTITLVTVIASLVKYIIVIVGLCWVLAVIGVNISTIFASIGIVALIIGFGAESLVADLVTGVFILFENQFNIGDIIEIDGFRGSVEAMGIRTISVRDTGGNIKIINNSDLKNIINRSEQGSVAISEVGVSYSTDLDELEKKIDGILVNIKEKHTDIFIGNIDYLGVEELADSSVVLKFKADVMEKDIFKGRRVLNKEIKCAFDREHIEIAFPQVDVHNR